MNEAGIARLTDAADLLRDNPADALIFCQNLLAEDEHFSPALLLMALVAFGKGDVGLAIELLERAHQMDPDCREYCEVLANICTRIGRLAEGLYYAKLTLSQIADPDLASFIPRELTNYRTALDQTGVSLHGLYAEAALRLGQFEEAIRQGEQELSAHRDDVNAMAIVARALIACGDVEAGLSYLRAAQHVKPQDPWLHAWIADALMASRRQTQAFVHQERALALKPDDPELLQHVVGAAEWHDQPHWMAAAPWRQRLDHQVRTARAAPAPVPGVWPGMIGVLFDQCHEGPLAHFVLPVLRKIDNSILYRLNQRNDHLTESFKNGVMRAHVAAETDVRTLGRIMGNEGLVAAINLCAPGVMAKYPRLSGEGAASSIQWLSFPMVDRVPGADLVLSDGMTEDLDRANFGEDRMIRLDQLVAYEFSSVPADHEMVGALPRRDNGHVTFGAFADGRYISETALALWAAALDGNPDAMLLVGGLARLHKEFCDAMRERLADFGLSNRVSFIEEDKSGAPLSSLMANIDILLDSTPVSNGHLVAHALWMGVPAITLRGPRRASRFAASVLAAAGRSEWIADDSADFTAIARNLAKDPSLADLRAGLRNEVMASKLADVTAFSQAMIAALHQHFEKASVAAT